MSLMNRSCHVWTRLVTHMNESCHTYEWVMSHIWMSHVAHMNASCHTNDCVTSHIWTRLVTHMNESYHMYQWPPLFYMTLSDGWHGSFTRVTWLIHLLIIATWLIHTCAVTHSNRAKNESCVLEVWHDSFAGVTWRIQMCDMTHSHVWHKSY